MIDSKNTSTALLTDFYQLSMAYGYWQTGIHENQASFSMIFRKNPFEGGYTVCAGLASVIEYINNFKFTDDDIAYLKSIGNSQVSFPDEFLLYLKNLQFSCDVEAIEEGTLVFPQEPLIRITGPLLQCQLLETAVLNIINFQTLIATKASRICYAARGEPVLEFGLRRAQGPDGGMTASRAAYIGGCTATSNVLAGKLFGIPVGGTHAHSWIMAFPTEIAAFEAYAKALPNNSIFLVDTYNTLQGVENAIEIGKRLEKNGHKFLGVRLDSGDLAYLSIEAKKRLDNAGFKDAVIIASNNLNEHIIASLKEQGAKINMWGVGTHLSTAYEQPALDGVYKLTAVRAPHQQWEYKLKLSEQIAKISTPGLLKVRRYYDENHFIADAIYDELLGITPNCTIVDPVDSFRRRSISANLKYEELSIPIYKQGKLIYTIPKIDKSRQKTLTQLEKLHDSIRRFLNPHNYPVGLEERLYELKSTLLLSAKNLLNSQARVSMTAKKALLLVDIQNDFTPGGALPVPNGDEVVNIANQLEKCFDLIIASQDWHPSNHASFASNHLGSKPGDKIQLGELPQILWPDHCVQNTKGAEFVAGLDTKKITKIFYKGITPAIDSYSAFFDNAHLRSTGLAEYLKSQDVTELYIMGLATDYCVKYSVIDACNLGFKTYVIEDGCRGIEMNLGDIEHALLEMKTAGASLISSKEVLDTFKHA